MPTLTCLRGLPGSGKTTFAMALLKEHGEAVRVSRDDLRSNTFGVDHGLSYAQETLITTMQRSMAGIALDAGLDVYVDDMNLRPKYLTEWDKFGQQHGADFDTIEINTDLEECIRNDFKRMQAGGRYVGHDVIRSIAAKYMPKGQFLPHTAYVPDAVSQFTPYANPPHLPHVVICDIDGTVALMGDRSPYDLSTVSQDAPNWPVIRAVWDHLHLGDNVVFLSGRDGSCREDTVKWLNRYFGSYAAHWRLAMRTPGDGRKDSIVKHEIFNKEIRDKFHVKHVYDDRDQVVAMWRAIGLTVFQVAEGAF